jgi:hypothetical protein
MGHQVYDQSGIGYRNKRRPDPRTAARITEALDEDGIKQDDLANGSWHRHYGHLFALKELDLGYRLVIIS